MEIEGSSSLYRFRVKDIRPEKGAGFTFLKIWFIYLAFLVLLVN